MLYITIISRYFEGIRGEVMRLGALCASNLALVEKTKKGTWKTCLRSQQLSLCHKPFAILLLTSSMSQVISDTQQLWNYLDTISACLRHGGTSVKPRTHTRNRALNMCSYRIRSLCCIFLPINCLRLKGSLVTLSIIKNRYRPLSKQTDIAIQRQWCLSCTQFRFAFFRSICTTQPAITHTSSHLGLNSSLPSGLL